LTDPKPNISIPGEAIDKATADVITTLVGGAAGGLVSTAGDIFGGFVGDKIRAWRIRNSIELAERTARLLKAKGVSLERSKALPMGEVYAIFEGASKVDDPVLQELWANLLAKLMDPEEIIETQSYFISILTNLTAIEAGVLNVIAKFDIAKHGIETERRDHLSENEPMPGDEVQKAYANFDEKLSAKVELLKVGYNEIGEGNVEIALPSLVQKRLLVPSNSIGAKIGASELVEAAEFRGGNEHIVSPSQLSDALNFLIDGLNAVAGAELTSEGTDFNYELFARAGSRPHLNYEFSFVGRSFTDACIEPS